MGRHAQHDTTRRVDGTSDRNVMRPSLRSRYICKAQLLHQITRFLGRALDLLIFFFKLANWKWIMRAVGSARSAQHAQHDTKSVQRCCAVLHRLLGTAGWGVELWPI